MNERKCDVCGCVDDNEGLCRCPITESSEMNNRISVVDSLFSWEEWDEIETGVFNFTCITMKTGIIQYPEDDVARFEFIEGKTFSHAVVNLQKCHITFYDTSDDEVGHKYNISLNIGDKQ